MSLPLLLRTACFYSIFRMRFSAGFPLDVFFFFVIRLFYSLWMLLASFTSVYARRRNAHAARRPWTTLTTETNTMDPTTADTVSRETNTDCYTRC